MFLFKSSFTVDDVRKVSARIAQGEATRSLLCPKSERILARVQFTSDDLRQAAAALRSGPGK